MSPPGNRKGRPGKATPKSAPTKALTRNSYPKEPLPANGETVVVVAHEPFGAGFDVRVIPQLTGRDLDREFQEHGEAQAYAIGLRQESGWQVIDRTEFARHG